MPGARKRLAFLGGVGGTTLALMPRFKAQFDVVEVPKPRMPALLQWGFRALSVRLPRHDWYREWRYHVEKTPFAFRAHTRSSARAMRALEGRYDAIFQAGATFAAGVPVTKPLFIMADSCRSISSRNPYDEVSHFRSERQRREWLRLEGEVYRGATRIFAGNSLVRRALIEDYGVDPGRAVITGFGPGVGFGEPFEKSFDGRTILYIGKGDFVKKGGTALLSAFELVRREVPEAVLHVVGQDRLPSVQGVVNHGFLRDRDKLRELMRAAHVFSLPSLIDRNPLSVIEAMSASTPCVVSDYGAIPEILGEGGLVTPCNDAPAIASALVRLLRDPELSRRLGRAGRARFEQCYHLDVIWGKIQREIVAGLAEAQAR
jgi:glycosyltransferase involved in cell wall biosynthesis